METKPYIAVTSGDLDELPAGWLRLVMVDVGRAPVPNEIAVYRKLLKSKTPCIFMLQGSPDSVCRFDLPRLLIPFLSGRNYHRYGGKLVIGLQGLTPDSAPLETLTKGLIEQRVEPGGITWMSQEERKPGCEILLRSASHFDWQDRLSQLMQLANAYIFFEPKDGDIQRVEREFFKQFQDQLARHPGAGRAYENMIRIGERYVYYMEQNRRLKDKLEIAESFVEVAKSKYKDDYQLLFDFYHQQYEVLPLWYKKFGHLIKIMIGKRKIDSYFGKKEKIKS